MDFSGFNAFYIITFICKIVLLSLAENILFFIF